MATDMGDDHGPGAGGGRTVHGGGEPVCAGGSERTRPRPGTAPGDRYWLGRAVELGRRCPPSDTAFAVGALIVAADGTPLAEGYSRAEEPADHAEEVALRRLGPAGVPPRATVYSSLEPCSARASRPRTCTQLLLAAGVGRVVFAWREPSIFVDCEGAELLTAAGVEVTELPEFADEVRAVNSHLLS